MSIMLGDASRSVAGVAIEQWQQQCGRLGSTGLCIPFGAGARAQVSVWRPPC